MSKVPVWGTGAEICLAGVGCCRNSAPEVEADIMKAIHFAIDDVLLMRGVLMVID